MKDKKIAIVYDWLDKWGGVERVLLTLHEMYPEAAFYTSYYDKEKAAWANELKIQTSFIQSLPHFIKKNRVLSLLLYPLAFETFNFSGYDTVISVTSSFAKGVITKPETNHICYLLTPPRYVWGDTTAYIKKNIGTKIGNKFLRNYLKKWDFIAAQRVDEFISISKLVSERCSEYYKRSSTVLYPPFDMEYWKSIQAKIPKNLEINALPDEPYYLVVSRLEPYKRVDLVLEAFKKIENKKVVIVGTGTEDNRLRTKAGNNVIFLGSITDEELAYLYGHAKGLIMPQEEDFGYVALEAQFFGCPVLSYQKSGARETVLNGKTGMFFSEQTAAAIAKKLLEFDIISYKLRENCITSGKKHIENFSRIHFESEFINFLSK